MNDCSCNGTLLSWVAGNDVLLLARVYEKVLDAGEVTDLPFDLSACDDISVTATAYKTETLEWAIAEDESNCLAVNIPHTLTVGEWAVEITCKRNGYHVRSFEFTFRIVETNCEAQTTFEVVDGCQSASVRVALQIVPQALVRGQNSYEMWKELPGNEGKTLQEYIDEVLDLNGLAARIAASEAQREANERGRVASETNRQEAEMQREANSQAAVSAADNAAAGAEMVNASLSGTTLTVTNRSGVSVSVDTKGEPGDDGVGVPSGGSAGQVLSKNSATDFDTQWINPPAAGVNSVNGKTGDVTLSASDVGALPDDTVIPDAVTEQTVSGWGFTKNTGTYSKPSGGIPSTDLSSDVQTSLGKADTALQSFAETDPTVPSWAKQSSKPIYTAQEVGALPADTPLFSGDYNDLDNKPNLATVATSGSYNDLQDTPTIPTVPTISTDIDTDGADDTKTTSPKAVKTFVEAKGYTTNTGTITGITMNGASKGTSGVVDLGTVITSHQDISGKADKSEMSVTASGDTTTIQLKSGTNATVINQHQSLSGKQDKIDATHKLSADFVDDSTTTNKFTNATEKQTWNDKQEALVSGTNIKTINNESLLGSGNISVAAELPSNLAYTSNDNGEGIIPSDGIRAVTVTSAAAMTISPDVVTVVSGAVGTAAITLQVPNDNLAHVWDILMTTGSSVAITFAMSNSETILYPDGFSVGASTAVEISVIGVGTKYYLRYGEFA